MIERGCVGSEAGEPAEFGGDESTDVIVGCGVDQGELCRTVDSRDHHIDACELELQVCWVLVVGDEDLPSSLREALVFLVWLAVRVNQEHSVEITRRDRSMN